MKVLDGKIYFKLLFAGTALAGKTTALEWIFDHAIPNEMKLSERVRSIKTSFQQTLLFDFVPIEVVKGVHFRIYASTGQDYYSRTRELLAEGVDGVFFVVDSQKEQLKFNREFVSELYIFLNLLKMSRNSAEVIVLYNKTDLPDIYDAHYLARALNLTQFPAYETCALSGKNLKEAFTSMIRLCLERLKAS